jgi:hypothetical protein
MTNKWKNTNLIFSSFSLFPFHRWQQRSIHSFILQFSCETHCKLMMMMTVFTNKKQFHNFYVKASISMHSHCTVLSFFFFLIYSVPLLLLANLLKIDTKKNVKKHCIY